MSQYKSTHSGSNIDEAVDKVLNGKSGVQGVKLYGNELSMDFNNKVNVSWDSLVSQGTWTPDLGELPFYIESTYDYRWGLYYKFGGLCYITFRLKAIITEVIQIDGHNVPLTVSSLPFRAKKFQGDREFSLSISELTQENYNIDFSFDIENNKQHGTTYCKVRSNSRFIDFLKSNGENTIRANVTNGGYLWISASGWYPIQEE